MSQSSHKISLEMYLKTNLKIQTWPQVLSVTEKGVIVKCLERF